MNEAVFPRNFLKAYPQAVRGEGCFVYTADGKRYLDASGGAAVVTIGHGVEEIARAMAEQTSPPWTSGRCSQSVSYQGA